MVTVHVLGSSKRDGFLDQVAGPFLVEFHRPGVCLIQSILYPITMVYEEVGHLAAL